VAVVVAAAEPAQFAAVLSFWHEATEVASSTDDLPGLHALWARDAEALLVATEDGVLVGTVIVGWDGWRGAFYRLAVQPDRRGRGIGRALVAAGEARLIRLGVRRVSLYAVEAHPAAMAFWPALGYARDLDDVRLVKNLDATQLD
jgi:ribosomal protein S18 acetylase RimI-like enzyme